MVTTVDELGERQRRAPRELLVGPASDSERSRVHRKTRTGRWIHGPIRDVALMLAWVPFTAAALMAGSDRGSLATVVAVTLLVSLAHQPLTLGLIYGDPAQFGVARRIFTYAPLVLLAAVLVGQHISLALVGAVAGLWNAEHTLMQRYGVVRIYGRKAGEGTRSDERPMLISWLVFALTWGAADRRTPALLARIDLGATNEAGVRVLHSLQPWARAALLPGGLAVVLTALRWWRIEHDVPSPSRPKRLYLLTTATLFVVTLVNPIAGLIGYVGAHAIEYVVIVHSALDKRYTGSEAEPGGLVGAAVRSRARATGCVFAYLVVVAGLLGSVQQFVTPTVASVVLLTVGGMHVLFDGFIWKLRRPVVGRSLR